METTQKIEDLAKSKTEPVIGRRFWPIGKYRAMIEKQALIVWILYLKVYICSSHDQ